MLWLDIPLGDDRKGPANCATEEHTSDALPELYSSSRSWCLSLWEWQGATATKNSVLHKLAAERRSVQQEGKPIRPFPGLPGCWAQSGLLLQIPKTPRDPMGYPKFLKNREGTK